MAVPTMVKIPEPITAPMPSEVRLSQPRDFFNRFSGCCESVMSWSISFLRKSCAPNRHLPGVREKLYLVPWIRATTPPRFILSAQAPFVGSDAHTSYSRRRKRLRGILFRAKPVGGWRNVQQVSFRRNSGSLWLTCALRLPLLLQ